MHQIIIIIIIMKITHKIQSKKYKKLVFIQESLKLNTISDI